MQIKQLGLLDENFRVSDRNAKRIFDMTARAGSHPMTYE